MSFLHFPRTKLFLFLLIFNPILWSAPAIINYAGQVSVNGSPFTGSGLFKFAMVHGSPNSVTSVWSNDGTSTAGSEPNNHVAVQVDGGLYSILLGNQAISGMAVINPVIFSTNNDLVLRVWFNDGTNGFQQLTPDRPLASVPYALSAERANILNGSISFNQLDSNLQGKLGSKRTATISSSHTITNEDIIFLQKESNVTHIVTLPSASANEGRTIRLVPGESPLRIEAADGELSGYDIAITTEVNELIANQSRWVTFGNAPVLGLREMLADINSGTGSSSPSDLTNVNGTLFFSANELKYGRELWKSDGTSAGTTLFKDIQPGAGSSSPSYLTNVNGTLFFSVNDGTNGIELWKSDGTSAGTTLVKDIRPGAGSSSPSDLTNVKVTLFFSLNYCTYGMERWKS